MLGLLLEKCPRVGAVQHDGASPLYLASAKGHYKAVAALLHAGADSKAVPYDPGSPAFKLHVAAERGYARVVQQLLDAGVQQLLDAAGVQPDLRNPAGLTALYTAAEHNHTAVVEVLLAAGAEVDPGHSSGLTPLHAAAERGYCEVVQLLLAKYANVHVVATGGGTPLHYAVRGRKGHPVSLKTVSMLLAHGAKVEERCSQGSTALFWAAEAGHSTAVSQLLDKQADVNAANNAGHTALHMAAVGGHVQVVQQLLNAHAHVDARDLELGMIPLFCAAFKGHVAAAEALLAAGADANAATAKWNLTPMHAAAEGGSVAMLKLLLERQANMNTASCNDATPLMLAAKAKRQAAVVELIQAGADVTTMDNKDDTVVHRVVRGGGNVAVSLIADLVQAGAPLDAQNTSGMTPLMCAASGGLADIATTL